MVLVDQTFGVGRQQEPRVRLEFGAAVARTAGLGPIAPEPGEVVSAGTANILRYRH